MEEEFNDEKTNTSTDPALLPMHQIIEKCVVPLSELNQGENPFYAHKIKISTPVEFDIIVQDDGNVVLGSAPPTSHYATSYKPIFHQLKMQITPKNSSRTKGR
ncbi:MAG: hypothetical protein HRT70_04385 [Flavobacteriaceae bacterium]|nr:hypothetical protein [Flavobacteriaceae bacterium]